MRPKSLFRLLPLLLTALFTASCGDRSVVAPSGLPSATLAVTPTPLAPGRVTIISIDGLRPDALFEAGAPNIIALAGRGAHTWRARTIMPSTTLPSHTSMLTGYAPDVHGISWDDYEPARGALSVPTLFGIAQAHGLKTAMVVGKEKFATFRDTGGCDSWVLTLRGDDDVASRAGALAGTSRPDLLFVHLPDVDLAGHASQWMSPQYLDAVRAADRAVGRLLASLPADMTVILTADHGGHLNNHGTTDAVDITIPWIIAGPAIASGRDLSSSVATMDTAATAALILGVQLSPDAGGRPVLEALRQR
ncbi:MAG: alkaline phosphatase family protein [Vicinamibacterales bacterium]